MDMIGVMAEELKGDVREGVSVSDFGSWMASEQRRIFLLCRRILQDPEEADSATQDVFFKAFRALNKPGADAAKGVENPDKWVTRIAVNTCYDRLRSKAWKVWRRRPAPDEEEAALRTAAANLPDAERQVFAKEIQRRLELAIDKLSTRQRLVFTLRHYEAMALDEIASALKLDSGTVKAHLFRATVKMREELKDLYGAR
jgi:RNA polymerase sigma-70 factor (ECF subfamily)